MYRWSDPLAISGRTGKPLWPTRKHAKGDDQLQTEDSVGIKVRPLDVEEGVKQHMIGFQKVQTELKKEARSVTRDYERGLISRDAYEAAIADILEKTANLRGNVKELREKVQR